MNQQVEPGQIWRHFKGGLYEVQFIAKHCETEETLVVYRPLYHAPKNTLWVRPLESWLQVLGEAPTFFGRFERLAIAESCQYEKYKSHCEALSQITRNVYRALDFSSWKEKRYALAKLIALLGWSEGISRQQIFQQIRQYESLLIINLPKIEDNREIVDRWLDALRQ